MKYGKDRAWLEIDLDIIKKNYLNIMQKLTKDCQIIAVLKADAYGLGSVQIGKALEKIGCPLFAVATIQEAMELRENGIKTPIMLLSPINPAHVKLAADNSIEISLVSYAHADTVSNAALACGKVIKGHLKIDSGLSRYGIVIKDRFDEAVSEINKIVSLPQIDTVAAYTHTTNSDLPGGVELDRYETELFAKAAARLKKDRTNLKFHCLSSSTAENMLEYSFDYIRVGVLFMGPVSKDSEYFNVEQSVGLKTRICQIKRLERGTPVSYGPTFTTLRPTRIALVPIGFADGLRRSISNKGFMLLHGKRAPIIGKICCDCTILDVTDIPEAAENDIVTIFGCDNGLCQYPYDYAAIYPASVPEVTSTISPRIPRFYMENGKTFPVV